MPSRGRLIAVEGISAAGKSTLVSEATSRLGWTSVREAFDRLEPAPSLDFGSERELLQLESMLLREESRRYRDARELARKGRTVLTDTGFLGPLTYTLGLVARGNASPRTARRLLELAASRVRRRALGIPDLTVYLETTRDERSVRGHQGAVSHPAALVRRHERVGLVERGFYFRALGRARPGRIAALRGHARPELLVRHLEKLVRATPVAPATRREAEAVLADLGALLARYAPHAAAPTVKKATRSRRPPRPR